ncbi:MAG: diguanylate cyclase domain-containing protein, partial [Acidimicrobiales bacterium]
LDTEHATIYLGDLASRMITTVYAVGVEDQWLNVLRQTLVGTRADEAPLWKETEARSGRAAPVAVEDARQSDLLSLELVDALHLGSFITLPLLSAEGAIGLVVCSNTYPRQWSEHNLELANQLAVEGSMVVDHARLRESERERLEELAHQAFHDSLTGLPNRAQLQERLHQALGEAERRNEHLALLLIDLDEFKEVNDTLGHEVGDQLLQQVGGRLNALLRKADVVCRLGGDEFAVLMTTDVRADGPRVLADRIEEALEEPFTVGNVTMVVQASIGIAVFPDHGGDPVELMRKADSAMYEAKRSGGGHAIYSAKGDGRGVSQLALLAELQSALGQDDQLYLDYLPQ